VHLLLHGLKLSESSRQALIPAQQETWASMLQHREASLKRTNRQADSGLVHRLNEELPMLRRMWEIQHAHRVWSMQVNKALNPVCPISDGADGFGLTHSSSLHLSVRHIPKRLCVRHTRKGGQMTGMRLTLSLDRERFFPLPNRSRSDLGPCSSDQRTVGSIDTDHLVLTLGLGS
jgi:hypothetical protein